MSDAKDTGKEYKDTLNLPQTDFPMKANLAQREPEFLKKWDETRIYDKGIQKNAGKPKFVLHDGPPYANGHIHFGHILNKTLKDILVKYKTLAGFQSEFIPGWDCHGLPIEHQVDKELGPKKKTMDVVQIRQACRAYAGKFVDIQRAQFKRLGIMANWEAPYLTMDYSYEAAIARTLGKLVGKGMVYKGKKPVHWCIKDQTALAEAEVEYDNHLSPSIYVKFESLEPLKDVTPQVDGKKVKFIIWTTTPWTLPANLAIAIHKSYTYVALQVGEEIYIVAEGLLDQVRKTLNFQEDRLLDRIPAKKLEGILTKHPFLERTSKVILSDHVTLEAGTGVVHIAPGHGQEDYEVGMRYGLAILNPVDNEGKFTAEVSVPELVGQSVFQANPQIIELLRSKGALVKAEETSHSYPHCWRCKSPVIFRSTPQYFISLSTHDLRGRALDAIRRTEWIPHWGRERIYGMVENRPDWCISRQRSWGVPIMGFRCTACKESLLREDVIEGIAKRFEKEGADAYFKYPAEELLPPCIACPQCGGKTFEKETDILDVWFDSGVSFAAVLEQRPTLQMPADIYLEGSDQHRGWFHSSLLAAIGSEGRAPYKAVLTHGFVVDGEGRKYSKSAKNYTPPEDLINKLGAEVLRLWVAAEDYRNDIRYSNEILDRLVETYRKIRNTCRFLLGNLYDFNPDQDTVPVSERPELDRWAVASLQEFIQRVTQSYENFEFHVIYHSLNQYCTVTLSAFYLDILKDRLYTSKAEGRERRAAQSTVFEILTAMTRLMAPILSFTADEVYQHTPAHSAKAESVFLSDLPVANESLIDKALLERFEKIDQIRQEVLKALEKARQEKVIGHSLEAQVRLSAEGEWKKFLQEYLQFWSHYFIVSQVVVAPELDNPTWTSQAIEGLKVEVKKAEGEKCGRCWTRSITVGKNPAHPALCDRCGKVLS
ncbi:MAG: isoleucine--tRNA ligase [Deltaproteobacteria bacterium]|nr:isoleucine--tRNA ligase [Deltaproteobacteria bacterium]